MFTKITRRSLAALSAISALCAFGMVPAHAEDAFPKHPIELVVPFAPGGGTDALARSFAEAAGKHMPVSIVVANKAGASGAVGWQEVINSKPDGYRLAVVTVELAILPHLGVAKFNPDDLQPIARLNADPSAITVRADAPWNTVEEFLAAARKDPGKVAVGNAGPGSIWHLAATALQDKTGVKFMHVPFQGAGPAVLALLGGHIDAVAVSPAEVTSYVASGKLKMLAVMADHRVKGFENVPTLKERHIDLSIGTWRGLAAPRNTPPEVISYLKKATLEAANEPAFRATLDNQNLGFSYADDVAFKAAIAHDNAYFKSLIDKLGIRGN